MDKRPNSKPSSQMVHALQLGDLVRHKHLGGIGIITGEKTIVSNITMGSATKFIVEWLYREHPKPAKCDYFPAFLERVVPTDKNCPPN